MINVSNSFKKAIKESDRKIFGYVDIKYQNNNYNTSVSQEPTILPVFKFDGIISGSKVMQKYATLDDNYTLLDGSFMVWNENIVDDKGYMSNDIFENITNTSIIISNVSSPPVKGITIYFKENLPFDFVINITDINNNVITHTVTNNTRMVYQYILEDEIYVSSVELTVSRVEFPKNRLTIACIDFNLSDFYEGEELVKFNVTEELNLLLESIPINTCSVNVNNYPSPYIGNKFDVINPKGIVKYLTDNVTLSPYIGVLTEENGIEYVPMGTFYLSDWTSDTDGNVTLNGQSVLSKLNNEVIKSDGYFLKERFFSDTLSSFLSQSTNYIYNFITSSYYYRHIMYLKDFNLMNYLKNVMICMLYFDQNNGQEEFRKFYVDRYNRISLDNINFNSISTISRLELKKDVEYTSRERIKTLNIKYASSPIFTYDSSSGKKTLISTTYELTRNEEYIWLSCDQYIYGQSAELQTTIVSGNATATLIDYNNSSIYVKITGSPYSKIQINYVAYEMQGDNIGTTTKTITNNNISMENSLTIDTSSIIQTIAYDIDQNTRVFYPFEKLYFGLDKPYSIKAETMGDPSIEIGDTVSIQTRYQDINDGYKDVIVTKQSFTFDGGLQCVIEGVGD